MNTTVKRARKADAPRPVEASVPSVSPQASRQDEQAMTPVSFVFDDLQAPQAPVESSRGGSPTPSLLSSLYGMDEIDGTIESSNSQQSSVASEEHFH